jgi:hypothetical protein
VGLGDHAFLARNVGDSVRLKNVCREPGSSPDVLEVLGELFLREAFEDLPEPLQVLVSKWIIAKVLVDGDLLQKFNVNLELDDLT